MTNSLPIQSAWIRISPNSNFSNDLFCCFQKIKSELDSADNFHHQECTSLMLKNAFGTKLEFLTDAFLVIGLLAKRSRQGICNFIEDIHCLKKDELQALTMAIHRLNQKRFPIMISGSGSPSIIRLLGDACPYSERLFIFSPVSFQTNETNKLNSLS